MFLAHCKKWAKKHIGLKSTNKYIESVKWGYVNIIRTFDLRFYYS